MSTSEPTIQAYPLAWPAGWKRTPDRARRRAKFLHYGHALSVINGITRVGDELERMGASRHAIVISTNLLTRLDGLPRSDQREPTDPGVAVYWRRQQEMSVMAIDRYDRVADNLAAIAATLEALRAIARHGGALVLERAFTGFTALPAPGQTSAPGWRAVLGEDIDSVAALESRYKQLRSRHHPDKPGGSAQAFHTVQQAYEQARLELAS